MNNFCKRTLLLTGVHPRHPLGKIRIAFNVISIICMSVLGFLNLYKEKKIEVIESLGMFLFLLVKYLAFVFGRNIVNRLLDGGERFWQVTNRDKEVTDIIQLSKMVEKYFKFMLIPGILIFPTRQFLLKENSLFNCYKPPQIPTPLFFVFEMYFVSFSTSVCVCFNIFVCSLVIRTVAQFKMLNMNIKTLDFSNLRYECDLRYFIREMKQKIKYHQFLISYVEDLNRLLSAPIALLMVAGVTVMCMELYIVTIGKGSIVAVGKVFMVTFAFVGEFITVYSVPAQMLMDEASETSNMIYYELKWYLPEVLHFRRDLLMMIARSQKAICIRAGEYHLVCHETVVVILKTAYSFYTFLQTVM